VSIYLDSSALVKLLVVEPETTALQSYLRLHDSTRVTCELARVEVVRAVGQAGSQVEAEASRLLSGLHLMRLSRDLLEHAARLGPRLLRSLDAIHLAAALRVPDLDTVITYDSRMFDAAKGLGLTSTAPA